MVEKQQKYRINENLLHTKNLGRRTLTDVIISIHQVTNSWCGTFYHYTSPEGLIGILQNKHIYFTDCQFLNDYKERLEINDELKYFWANNKRKYDKEFYKLLDLIRINAYEDSDFSYCEGDKVGTPCRYFVMSTSRDRDSLNMWKYYAKNGTYNGYCLGLFTAALTDEWIDRETGVAVECGDVIYNHEDKQNKIYSEVEKIYDIWCKYKRSDELDAKISRDFKAWVSYASIFFKNSSFASEGEYRFVAIVPTNKLNDLSYKDGQKIIKMYDFRTVNGVIVPYLKMPFCCYNEEENMVINSIGVGPSLDFEQKKNGIIQIVNSLQYKPEHIEIYKSEIPLRY